MCETIRRGSRNQMIVDGTFVVGESGPCIPVRDGFDEVDLCFLIERAETIALLNSVGGLTITPDWRAFGYQDPSRWINSC